MLLFSWCVGNGTPSTAKKKACAVIFVVRRKRYAFDRKKKKLALSFLWCVGNGTPSTAKKKACAVIFVVRPQGLVGSPKASVIESEAKDLQKANVSLVCRGSPRKAWLQHGCKSPDDAKK